VYNGDKLTHFSVSKIGITKFLWGDLGTSPHHNFLAVGHRPWSRCLWYRSDDLRMYAC